MWDGAIAFGPVTIPVRLYPATYQRDLPFRQVHREDGGKITFRRYCATCGKEVPYSEVAKGYQLPGGDIVTLSDEDFAGLPLENARRIQVEYFTAPAEIDPILTARTYHVAPEPGGAAAYALFRAAMERTGTVAIVTLTLRQREALAEMRVSGGVIVLRTLLGPDEVAEPGFPVPGAAAGVSAADLRRATSLIESMTRKFDPAAHHDRYPAELGDLARHKLGQAAGAGAGHPGETTGPAGPAAGITGAASPAAGITGAASPAAGTTGAASPAAGTTGNEAVR